MTLYLSFFVDAIFIVKAEGHLDKLRRKMINLPLGVSITPTRTKSIDKNCLWEKDDGKASRGELELLLLLSHLELTLSGGRPNSAVPFFSSFSFSRPSVLYIFVPVMKNQLVYCYLAPRAEF